MTGYWFRAIRPPSSFLGVDRSLAGLCSPFSRGVGATMTGNTDIRRRRSLTPLPEIRLTPCSRRLPSTMASQIQHIDSSTIRCATWSSGYEQERPSAPTPASRNENTASSTRDSASAGVSKWRHAGPFRQLAYVQHPHVRSGGEGHAFGHPQGGLARFKLV